MQWKHLSLRLIGLCLLVPLLAVGCNDDDDGGSTTSSQFTNSFFVGSTVQILDPSSSNAVLATGTTGADGTVSFGTPSGTGPFIMQATGGNEVSYSGSTATTVANPFTIKTFLPLATSRTAGEVYKGNLLTTLAVNIAQLRGDTSATGLNTAMTGLVSFLGLPSDASPLTDAVGLTSGASDAAFTKVLQYRAVLKRLDNIVTATSSSNKAQAIAAIAADLEDGAADGQSRVTANLASVFGTSAPSTALITSAGTQVLSAANQVDVDSLVTELQNEASQVGGTAVTVPASVVTSVKSNLPVFGSKAASVVVVATPQALYANGTIDTLTKVDFAILDSGAKNIGKAFGTSNLKVAFTRGGSTVNTGAATITGPDADGIFSISSVKITDPGATNTSVPTTINVSVPTVDNLSLSTTNVTGSTTVPYDNTSSNLGTVSIDNITAAPTTNNDGKSLLSMVLKLFQVGSPSTPHSPTGNVASVTLTSSPFASFAGANSITKSVTVNNGSISLTQEYTLQSAGGSEEANITATVGGLSDVKIGLQVKDNN